MFVIRGGEAALIQEESREGKKKKKRAIGAGGAGQAGLCCCVGSWHGSAAVLNLFCRDELWVLGLAGLGKKGLEQLQGRHASPALHSAGGCGCAIPSCSPAR